jgi:DoxX-like protein
MSTQAITGRNLMESTAPSSTVSSTSRWAGRILSTLAVLFLIMDSGIKILRLAPAVQGTVGLGYAESAVVPIGVVLLICTLLYIFPRTAIFGAVLLTGYLGGAVASQVRAGNPLFSHVLFPVYFAALMWGGLYLRDASLRVLLPLRKMQN